MSKVLAIAPHPDDEIIGCGGSILKHRNEFPDVSVCYVTYGDCANWDCSREEYAQTRKREAERVCEKLKASGVHFLGEPDSFLVYSQDLVKKLTRVIREEKPDRVYIPNSRENDHDHRVTHDVVKDAILWASFPYFPECLKETWVVPEILCYEIWTPMDDFNLVEDITPFMDKKLELLREYASQLQVMRYDEAIRALNRYRGIMLTGGEFCEVFKAIKIKSSK